MSSKVKYERLENDEKENPVTTANFFSILSFWWMNSILSIGSKRQIEKSDLFRILDGDKTRTTTDILRDAWNQGPNQQKGTSSCRLFMSLFNMVPYWYYLLLISIGLLSAICNISQTVFLGMILAILLKIPGYDRDNLYVYGAALCICSLVRVLLMHQFLYKSWLIAMKWRTSTMGLMFNKIFHLSQTTIAECTTGYIINLVSGDVQRFDPVASQMALLVQGLFEVVVVSIVLAHVVGIQALSGAVFLYILVFYFLGMGKLCVYLRNQIAKIADKRLGFMTAIISGARTVKMYAWEQPFWKRLSNIRRFEIRYLKFKGIVLSTSQTFLYTAQSFAAFISLLVMMSTGIPLNTFNIFMTLAFLNTLRSSVSWNIAEGANYIGDFISALGRIQNFLELPELQENALKNVKKVDSGQISKGPSITVVDTNSNTAGDKAVMVSLENVSCHWNGDSLPCIADINLNLKERDLVLVTGPVGCGKTSLLSTILGELPVKQGKISVNGKTVFVPQQPWVFSGTVMENIIFGKKFNRAEFKAVLKACDLENDINCFPNGDQTVIGERGVLLSGGQRARVGLARALYADGDVYLLDDPLSAVDAKVGRHIFMNCICGLLRNKTRILVTHQIQYLKGADHVVVMDKGSVAYEGSYEDLSQDSKVDKIEFLPAKYDDSPPLTRSAENQGQKEKDKAKNGLEVVDEDRVEGSVSANLYWNYLVYGIPSALVMLLALYFTLTQVGLILPDWWLLHMSRLPSKERNSLKNIYIYGGLVVMAFSMAVSRAVMFFFSTLNSSKNLHDAMAKTVMRSPVLFFDTNPAGRILNRFSRDVGVMDDLLPLVFLDALQLILFCIGAIILPSILNPWVVVAALPMAIMFFFIGKYYLRTSRELRRLEAMHRSPVFSHFSDTLEGLVTVRNHSMEEHFTRTFYRHQDDHTRVWFSLLSSLRWLGVRLDFLCVCFTTVVVFAALAVDSGAGSLALSLIYALQLAVDTSQYGVRQCSETENYMTSVERVMTYTQIEPEPGYDYEKYPPSDWPREGHLELQDVSLAYYPEAPMVLKNVSFVVNPKEKIGIAGRTGAGKSSIVSALFRMPEAQGKILIDGLDIMKLNLQSSRQSMAVISQDPVLFTGTLRFNLDPFEKYSDAEVWDAIDGASLTSTIQSMPEQLNQRLKEQGVNMSAGERQLLCLARALLQKTKIIVMDEATANVDYKTDGLIQHTIRTKFRDCTVITIAHRLNTIMDYDKILVLENGQVIEFDSPQGLIENEKGMLKQLISISGL